jgi:DNA-binding Lrp family transcriptional regulator
MIDSVDKQLILATQAGLPLSKRPYLSLAKQLDITEENVLQRLQKMQKKQIIRRIAIVPNHYRLGYTENAMSVWDIEDNMITALGKKVGALDFVSHCYHRPRHLPIWTYNLFAMLHAKDKKVIEEQVKNIKTIVKNYCRCYELIYSQRILKKTGLRLSFHCDHS